MERADAHLHLFASGYPGRYGRSPAGGDELAVYGSLRRTHGIDRALVVGYEGAPEFVGNNAYLAGLAADHDWIAPVAYVPPGGPTDPSDLRRWWAEGFVGISAYLADPEASRAFGMWLGDAAADLDRVGAVLSLNATPAATAHLGPALAALGDCTVLVSHLGLPGAHPVPPGRDTAASVLAPLLGLAELPHVGVKLSGLYAISEPAHAWPHDSARPFVEVLLGAFGPQRLYWGSDFSPSLDHVSFAQTLHPVGLDGLSPAEAADVYGGNLCRVLPTRAGVVTPGEQPHRTIAAGIK
ncbi:amidohydrolase family protein [Micromonospora sp. NPDC050187]|uniref:amidohydrolase family protein n=1 Tax=Micromonospora sp. NPDC050187 TaxID=3364277 RepID=UPI0037A2C06E